MNGEPYDLVWSRLARRALAEELPESVAAAAIELILGLLRMDPRRVGKALKAPYEGRWVARRSTYRVRYGVDEDKHLVIVLDIRHRSTAYRSR